MQRAAGGRKCSVRHPAERARKDGHTVVVGSGVEFCSFRLDLPLQGSTPFLKFFTVLLFDMLFQFVHNMILEERQNFYGAFFSVVFIVEKNNII